MLQSRSGHEWNRRAKHFWQSERGSSWELGSNKHKSTSVLSTQVEDAPELLETKLCQLADIIRISDRVVFHTGAGLSTAAGIPDFRGPQGVWTLQKKGQVAGMNMRYEEARPTQAHMAIGEMVRRGLVSHVVTQNGESRCKDSNGSI